METFGWRGEASSPTKASEMGAWGPSANYPLLEMISSEAQRSERTFPVMLLGKWREDLVQHFLIQKVLFNSVESYLRVRF